MEVSTHKSPKKLHHHTLPVIILAIAFLVVSAPFVLQQSTVTGNGVALAHDLFTRPLHITPSSNGFVHLTPNKNTAEHISPEIEQAGRTTELIFTLNNSD